MTILTAYGTLCFHFLGQRVPVFFQITQLPGEREAQLLGNDFVPSILDFKPCQAATAAFCRKLICQTLRYQDASCNKKGSVLEGKDGYYNVMRDSPFVAVLWPGWFPGVYVHWLIVS